MATVTIKKGLDVPIQGAPKQEISNGRPVTHVGVVGLEFHGMKPRMMVKVGERVARGEPLFEDRKKPGVLHTAPGAGEVVFINRGEKRVLESVVIELSEAELDGNEETTQKHPFLSFADTEPQHLDGDQVRGLLLESGAWTLFRTRPFDHTPAADAVPTAIFVNAMDTSPLAADPDVVVEGQEQAFADGLAVIANLGSIRLVVGAGSKISGMNVAGVELSTFSGPHPAGLVGTHIHFLHPVSRDDVVWHLDYQAVIAIGRLFRTGELDVSRVVSLAGPPVKKPRLVRTRDGASLIELVEDEHVDGEHRLISGSVLNGRDATQHGVSWLGRFDRAVSVLAEDREREFIGWLKPGGGLFSTTWTTLGSLVPNKTFGFTTSLRGEHRDMVPIGSYERVMPLDIMPTFLLRSLLVGDIDKSEALGALELAEEDLGLCSFVCPAKLDHQSALRGVLERIHKEG